MSEIIGSVLTDSVSETLRRARLAAMAGADWLELRIDRLPVDTDPKRILAELRLPVLVACRTPRDGGHFHGELEGRRQLLQRWVDAGVDGLDLEAWETWVPDRVEGLRVMMRSYHNFTGIDENLPAIRDALLKTGANVAKIAVTAHDLAEAAPVLDLIEATDQKLSPTVAFAMGEDAWVTRVLACVYGAPFVYGSVGQGLATAPGQVPVAQLAQVFDVHRWSGKTLIYGVLGNPARGSWGPWLFNRAFRFLDHDGVYLPFTTAHPLAAMNMLSRRRLRGLSVTAPHKAALLKICHEVDEWTGSAGALNTVTFPAHGRVVGHNTDVFGVCDALERAGFRGQGGRAVVLGGGGAGRAAALALAHLGLRPVMMPRSLDPVRDFAQDHGFQLARLDAAVLADLAPEVVVHATPVGGPADPPGTRILPEWKIPAGIHVLDMIYQTRWTQLLRDAHAAGAVPVAGLEMFLSQANEQLDLFTGRRLSREILTGFVGRR